MHFGVESASQRKASFIGLGFLWVSLTLLFEYGFGYFLLENTVNEIGQVFNVLEGNLFILVLVTTLIGPHLIAQYKS
jgi:hypothetical protein